MASVWINTLCICKMCCLEEGIILASLISRPNYIIYIYIYIYGYGTRLVVWYRARLVSRLVSGTGLFGTAFEFSVPFILGSASYLKQKGHIM